MNTSVRAKFIYEALNFTDDSDPIKDMGIGVHRTIRFGTTGEKLINPTTGTREVEVFAENKLQSLDNYCKNNTIVKKFMGFDHANNPTFIYIAPKQKLIDLFNELYQKYNKKWIVKYKNKK